MLERQKVTFPPHSELLQIPATIFNSMSKAMWAETAGNRLGLQHQNFNNFSTQGKLIIVYPTGRY